MDPPDDHDPPLLQQQRLRFMRHCVTTLYLMIASLLGALRAPPQPFHTSILTGEAWVAELLLGHPNHILFSLGVSRDTFLELIAVMRQHELTDSRHVSLEEQLAIFLHASVTGLTTQHLAERFQRSNETITR
jgi:hypothetical protein